MPLGVAWGVLRWARSAIGSSDERASVNVSDSLCKRIFKEGLVAKSRLNAAPCFNRKL